MNVIHLLSSIWLKGCYSIEVSDLYQVQENISSSQVEKLRKQLHLVKTSMLAKVYPETAFYIDNI